MAAPVYQMNFKQDIAFPITIRHGGMILFTGDNLADTVSVSIFENGAAHAISGTVTMNCIRADGATVAVTGSVSGNTASATLTQACVAIPGPLAVVMKITSDSTTTTLLKVIYTVDIGVTGTAVDPGTIIPDINALISAVETAIGSIPADYSNLLAAIAPSFNPEASTPYPAGSYVWYPGLSNNPGALYRFTAAHSGSWTGLDVEAVVFGNELSDLKNASNSMPRILDSHALGVDLDIADEDGYVLVRLKDGHIETKNFNSKDFSVLKINQMPYVADSTANGIDLDVADREGYVLLRLKDGHIETKEFDSRDIVGILTASNTDVGKIPKVKSVSDGKVIEWEFAETAGTDDDLIINIPAKLYATEGIECNIYFENLCDDWERYNWDVTCTKGIQLERGYRITPVAADAGSYSLKIKATRIDNKDIFKVATATLIISTESAGTGDTVKVIVLGDSTTAGGTAVTKLHSDIDGTGMTIETLGTRGTSPNNHEGRAGWRFRSYFNSGSDETTNPFYNPTTQTFDASYYFTNTGTAIPDWFIINLGINDVFGALSDSEANTEIDSVFGYADAMISSILSVSQSIKVGLCLTIPPNDSQDAFGKDYGCGQTRNRYKANNTILVSRMINKYDNKESDRVYLIPINTALDTVYNMTRESNPVNARNTSVTYMSPTGNAAVHPNETGYWQVADVYTAFIKGNV